MAMGTRQGIASRPLRSILTSYRQLLGLAFLALLCLCPASVAGIKFELPSDHSPAVKCIWNYALADTLVVITINAKSDHADDQRIDVEVVDGSKHNNVYLSKRGIGKTETRMAINTHSHADLGVCLKNTLKKGVSGHRVTVIDMDVDIGADAVDYNAIANQESLSGLETEMRKLEAVASEIVNEMDYLKKRETKMRDTNGELEVLGEDRRGADVKGLGGVISAGGTGWMDDNCFDDSTNHRVENFAWITLLALLCLGSWQVFYLRSFFKRLYLID